MNQEDSYQLSRAILMIGGGIVAIAFGATALGASITCARSFAEAVSNPTPLLGVTVGVVRWSLPAKSKTKPLTSSSQCSAS